MNTSRTKVGVQVSGHLETTCELRVVAIAAGRLGRRARVQIAPADGPPVTLRVGDRLIVTGEHSITPNAGGPAKP